MNQPSKMLFQLIPYPQALPAGIAAGRPDGSAEGGPRILASPRERLIPVPGGAEGAHCIQIPPVLLRVVEMVCGPHHGPHSWWAWARPAAVALASLRWGAIFFRAPAVPPLAAAQAPITHPPPCLSSALLGLHHPPAVEDHHCCCSPYQTLPRTCH